jgi:hypothetical protein
MTAWQEGMARVPTTAGAGVVLQLPSGALEEARAMTEPDPTTPDSDTVALLLSCAYNDVSLSDVLDEGARLVGDQTLTDDDVELIRSASIADLNAVQDTLYQDAGYDLEQANAVEEFTRLIGPELVRFGNVSDALAAAAPEVRDRCLELAQVFAPDGFASRPGDNQPTEPGAP